MMRFFLSFKAERSQHLYIRQVMAIATLPQLHLTTITAPHLISRRQSATPKSTSCHGVRKEAIHRCISGPDEATQGGARCLAGVYMHRHPDSRGGPVVSTAASKQPACLASTESLTMASSENNGRLFSAGTTAAAAGKARQHHLLKETSWPRTMMLRFVASKSQGRCLFSFLGANPWEVLEWDDGRGSLRAHRPLGNLTNLHATGSGQTYSHVTGVSMGASLSGDCPFHSVSYH